jgi:hypothetical protein
MLAWVAVLAVPLLGELESGIGAAESAAEEGDLQAAVAQYRHLCVNHDSPRCWLLHGSAVEDLRIELLLEENPLANTDDPNLLPELKREAIRAFVSAAGYVKEVGTCSAMHEEDCAAATEAFELLEGLVEEPPMAECGPAPDDLNTVLGRIFVVHYSKLTERRWALNRSLKKQSLLGLVEWIDDWDRERLTDQDFSLYYQHFRFISLTNQIDPMFFWRFLNPPEVANGIAHYQAFKRTTKAQIQLPVLILEDDAVLPPNFASCLASYLAQLNAQPGGWDVLVLGNEREDLFGRCEEIEACRSRPANVYRKMYDPDRVPIWLPSKHNIGQFAHAYIVTPRVAALLYGAEPGSSAAIPADQESGSFMPLVFPSDFMLSLCFNMLQLKVFWAEPGLVGQSSNQGEGRVASSMQNERTAAETAKSVMGGAQQREELVRFEALRGVKEYALSVLDEAARLNPSHCDALKRT